MRRGKCDCARLGSQLGSRDFLDDISLSTLNLKEVGLTEMHPVCSSDTSLDDNDDALWGFVSSTAGAHTHSRDRDEESSLVAVSRGMPVPSLA